MGRGDSGVPPWCPVSLGSCQALARLVPSPCPPGARSDPPVCVSSSPLPSCEQESSDSTNTTIEDEDTKGDGRRGAAGLHWDALGGSWDALG